MEHQEKTSDKLLEVKAEKVSAVGILLKSGVPAHQFFVALLIGSLSVLISLFHLYAAGIGGGEAFLTRTFVVSVVMVIGLLLYPLGRKSWTEKFTPATIIDLILILTVVAIQGYVFYAIHTVGAKFYAGLMSFSALEIAIGCIYTLILFEVTRRSAGWPIVIVALVFIVYAFYARYFPGVFKAPNTSLDTMVRNLFFNTNGIFGVPVAAMIDYVVIFVIFGTVLGAAGAGKFFTDLATALTGGYIGGPAKAAVVSSAFMGTISGSAVSNVVTTGSVTIPLMRSLGYRPAFAGAVEAVASTGGQIMPPIMGAVAFIMAQFLGVPYVQVAVAAAVPAILYFWAAYCAVHVEAVRLKLPALPKESLPKVKDVLKDGWYYFIPIAAIVWMLAENQSLTKTAFTGVVLAFLTSFVKKETRMTPVRILEVLEQAGRSCITVIIAAAAAGVIIAALNSSGLSWRISGLLIGLAGDQLWIALVFSAVIAIILGMGISTTAVYVTMAGLLIPAIVKLGIEPMAAHMFALYYAVLGLITPPVALSAFAAAGIADEKPMKVGWVASKIAFPIYLVPFIFVYHPVLLLKGDWWDIAVSVVTAVIGIWVFTKGSWGYIKAKLNVIERVLMIGAGVMLIWPNLLVSLAGLAIGFLVYMIHNARHRPAARPS